MIGKSITSHSPRQQCIATSLLDAIATDLVTKSFSLGFTYSKPISIALSLTLVYKQCLLLLVLHQKIIQD
jgi:hypothetical protein